MAATMLTEKKKVNCYEIDRQREQGYENILV